MKNKIFCIFLSLLLFFIFAQTAGAVESASCYIDFISTQNEWGYSEDVAYPLEVPLGADVILVANLMEYIKVVYGLVVGAGALLAFAGVIFGGFLWAGSGGNESTITSARGIILGSIVGLILLLCSYMILNFINPQLINLQKARIPRIPPPKFYDDSCVADPATLVELKTGGISTGTGCPNILKALNKAAANLAAYNTRKGTSRVITGSGWRTAESQWHLRQCYCHWAITKDMGSPECGDGLCLGCIGCGSCNYAGQVCGGGSGYGAGHLNGLAVDVNWSDPVEGTGKRWYCNDPTMFPSYNDPKFWATLDATKQAQLSQDELDLHLIMTGKLTAVKPGVATLNTTGYVETGLKPNLGSKGEFWHFSTMSTDCGTPVKPCPCTDPAPTNCTGDEHPVCDLDVLSCTKGEWECDDSTQTSCTTPVVSEYDTPEVTTYDCYID